MTAPDDRDDGDEDPKLRQLRAVWSSMPDEAPPQRGLAALMEAARVQATAMKRTSPWWQRLLATLRAPPVLGFATVAVLLGGAIVIVQNRDSMGTQRTVSSTADLDERPGSPPSSEAPSGRWPFASEDRPPGSPSLEGAAPTAMLPESQNQATPGSIEHGSAVAGAASPRRDATGSPHDPIAAAPPARQPAGLRRVPAREAPKGELAASVDEVGLVGRDVKAEEARARPSRGPAASATEVRAIARDDEGSSAFASAPTDAVSEEPAKRAQETTSVGAAGTATKTPGGAAGTATKTPGGAAGQVSTLEHMIKQCETAAARGDCAAVRTIVARIGRVSSGAYKDRLVKNASVARCLR